MSERKRLTQEVARLQQELVLAQKTSAEVERHLKNAALESQAAAERAETKCAAVLPITLQVIMLLPVVGAIGDGFLCISTTNLVEFGFQG